MKPFLVTPSDPRHRDLLDVVGVLQGTHSKRRALGDGLVLIETHDALDGGVVIGLTG